MQPTTTRTLFFKPSHKLFVTICCTLVLFAGAITAQADVEDIAERKNSKYLDDYWLEWKEDHIDSIPEFNLKKSLPLELNKNSQMHWYVDPATMSIGKDGVFRYVVIAQGTSGTINAFYEGVLCKKALVKSYAKLISSDGKPPFQWRIAKEPQWVSLDDLPHFGHEKMLARDYICDNAAQPSSVYDVKRRMQDFEYDFRRH